MASGVREKGPDAAATLPLYGPGVVCLVGRRHGCEPGNNRIFACSGCNANFCGSRNKDDRRLASSATRRDKTCHQQSVFTKPDAAQGKRITIASLPGDATNLLSRG